MPCNPASTSRTTALGAAVLLLALAPLGCDLPSDPAAAGDGATGGAGTETLDSGADALTDPALFPPRDSGSSDGGWRPGGGDGGWRPPGGDGGWTPPGARELVFEQLYMAEERIGEASLLIGPDGTTVMIDIGNQDHAASVLESVDHHLDRRVVDWVILTHWHGDHVGGFDSLFVSSPTNGFDPIRVRRGVINRGPYDIADGATHTEYEGVCDTLFTTAWAGRNVELCTGDERAGCSLSDTGGPWPASSCPGLFLGDLDDDGDDEAGEMSFIDLGSGARLYLYLADGFLNAGGSELSAVDEGVSLAYRGTGHENARSIAAFVSWGDFRFLTGGDMSGGGASTPDVESFVVEGAPTLVVDAAGTEGVPSGSVDLLHAHHHGYRTASNSTWLEWALPDDGQTRNALISASENHSGAPAQTTLDGIGDRLGDGWMWLTATGSGSGSHDRAVVTSQNIVLRVTDSGASYSLGTRTGETYGDTEDYTSTPD